MNIVEEAINQYSPSVIDSFLMKKYKHLMLMKGGDLDKDALQKLKHFVEQEINIMKQ